MNRDPVDSAGANAAASIELARETAFTLAHVIVTPAALTIETDAWSQRLEPRAMKVLVVLAQASPAVVGRAELNRRVWDGRVIGEDAINRAVQTLRRIAMEAPPPAPFRIETIPRVGYRLARTSGAAGTHRTAGEDDGELTIQALSAIPPPPGPMPAAPPRPRAHRVLPLALAILAVLAVILVWRGSRARDPVSTVWTIAGSAVLDDLPPGAGNAILSPDGRQLAYRGRDPQGKPRIFVRETRGGGLGMAVSPPELDARHPAWSADGAQLAFSAYAPDQPCHLYVLRSGKAASSVGRCETARDPRLAWSADGGSLLFGDAPGENAVQRITAIRIADGQRLVLSSPPGDSMGDGLPMPRGKDIVFQRQFAWADEGWIARDMATGSEHLLWRRRGVAGSVAALLSDGALAVAWTRAGDSGLDLIDGRGRTSAQPVALGPVTAISIGDGHLLVETDRTESMLARADGRASSTPLVTVRGRVSVPISLPDGRLRFPVASAGVARIWERDVAGALRPWGSVIAARISGLAPSPDGRLTAALVTDNGGRGIVVFDAAGRAIYHWKPQARSLNPAAWSGDGRRLITPVLDGAGWRLFALDPFDGAPPRDLGLPGFAVLQSRGSAIWAVRAGETTGIRELWRLDGHVRRLPIDVTLFDIVNWRPVADGVWLPDRRDEDRPRLVLRDAETGRVLRGVAAPGLAGSATGLAVDPHGPVYVKAGRDALEYALLTLSKARSPP